MRKIVPIPVWKTLPWSITKMASTNYSFPNDIQSTKYTNLNTLNLIDMLDYHHTTTIY